TSIYLPASYLHTTRNRDEDEESKRFHWHRRVLRETFMTATRMPRQSRFLAPPLSVLEQPIYRGHRYYYVSARRSGLKLRQPIDIGSRPSQSVQRRYCAPLPALALSPDGRGAADRRFAHEVGTLRLEVRVSNKAPTPDRTELYQAVWTFPLTEISH